MKKKKFFIATLLVAAAVSVTVVSCKKETPNALHNNNSQSVKTFAVPQVDDMNAYLKDFKHKMQNVTRDGNETLSLEEAAWHLSSVANYDFANANVEFTDLRRDTLHFQVNVTNGRIALTDLNGAYARMASGIDNFYQNLNLQEKHFRFIGTTISESGEIIVELVTTYIIFDHTWYFPFTFYVDTICEYYFSEDSVYTWNTNAANELERIANLLESRDYMMPGETPSSRMYYVYTTDVNFDFHNYIDPYGSPFIADSRIYAVYDDTNATPEISIDEMCYCLDSYLGLPFEYINERPSYGNQRPVLWNVEGKSDLFQGQHWWAFYHKVTVKLGQIIVPNDNPINY